MEPQITENYIHHLFYHKRTKKMVDTLAYFTGVAGNIAVIPQIIKAWQSDAPGLAVVTWALFVLVGLVWLAYAVLNRQKPLIVAQLVGLSCNIAVVGG